MTSPARPVDGGAVRRSRRWLRTTLLLLVAVVISVTFGVSTASAELSLGPHEARYDVTTDGTLTIDLGPLGTLQIDSPLPVGLGARVTVQEIPETVTEVGNARTLEALSNDLQSYLQFFAGPQATISAVVHALVVDAAWRAAMCLAALITAWFALGALVGTARRAELRRLVAPYHREIAVGTVVALLVLVAGSASSGPAAPTAQAQSSTVFNGTPLEGARVTGRLGGVINTYGSYAMQAYRQNEDFYAGARTSLVSAWEARTKEITDTELDEPAVEAPADGAPVVMLVVSDLHCNVGMAKLIKQAATLASADVILNAGDSTMDGTAVEKYCIDTFGAAAPHGVPTVVSGGNHDSIETSAQERAAGMTVLKGEVVTVKGVRILGDSDPNATRVGIGTSSQGETLDEAGRRLADVACKDSDGVDLLLIHTPRVGDEVLDSGCVPAQVSGHIHSRYGPVRTGKGVRYISSSTAGATSGQPTVGPLHGIAEMTVLRFDPVERRFLDYQVIQVHPDGTTSVGYRFTWPSTTALPGVLGTLLAPAPVVVGEPTSAPSVDPSTGAGQPEPTAPVGE